MIFTIKQAVQTDALEIVSAQTYSMPSAANFEQVISSYIYPAFSLSEDIIEGSIEVRQSHIIFYKKSEYDVPIVGGYGVGLSPLHMHYCSRSKVILQAYAECYKEYFLYLFLFIENIPQKKEDD